MTELETKIDKLMALIERDMMARIVDYELKMLGHRVVYDPKTGMSQNITGQHCDPKKLNKAGYQVIA